MQDNSLALTWHVAVRWVTWDRNQTQQILLGEQRRGMRRKWCEKALGCPVMARNSPSLSGSNGERQKRLRRKEYIRLAQKIWLFLSLCGRKHRGTCGGNQGDVDVGFGTLGRLSRSKLSHSTACLSKQITSLLLPPSILPQNVISVQIPHSVPVWKKIMKVQHWFQTASTNGKVGLKFFSCKPQWGLVAWKPWKLPSESLPFTADHH